MGNRAVIAFKSETIKKELSPAIYLHWNGSKYSVEAFLKAAKEFGIRGEDPTYCMSRLAQVIGNKIGGTLSMGIGCYGNFGHPGDNGVFWIKNWEIVEHDTDYEEDPYKDEWFQEVYQETLEANKEHFKQGAEVR